MMSFLPVAARAYYSTANAFGIRDVSDETVVNKSTSNEEYIAILKEAGKKIHMVAERETMTQTSKDYCYLYMFAKKIQIAAATTIEFVKDYVISWSDWGGEASYNLWKTRMRYNDVRRPIIMHMGEGAWVVQDLHREERKGSTGVLYLCSTIVAALGLWCELVYNNYGGLLEHSDLNIYLFLHSVVKGTVLDDAELQKQQMTGAELSDFRLTLADTERHYRPQQEQVAEEGAPAQSLPLIEEPGEEGSNEEEIQVEEGMEEPEESEGVGVEPGVIDGHDNNGEAEEGGEEDEDEDDGMD